MSFNQSLIVAFFDIKQFIQRIVSLLLVMLLIAQTSGARTVVLGFDGMDPQLLQNWMDSGDLPNFKALADSGHFQELQTTNPAQSPVAWASFATGLNPGGHGIFDFVHRNPATQQADYSISGLKPAGPDEWFGLLHVLGHQHTYNKRIGKPFWITAQQKNLNSSILRVPATYPPDDIHRMFSGMGVPDLLGTQGTYSYYSTKYVNPGSVGGEVVRVSIQNKAIETSIKGPENPVGEGHLSAPMTITNHGPKQVKIELGGEQIILTEGAFSEWIPLDFKYYRIFAVSGMVRLHLVEAFPRFKMYVSPIHIDPSKPLVPIASPADFTAMMSEKMGLFHTLGMPEETWSLNDGLISDQAFLEVVETVLAEREAMFFDQLADPDNELVVSVFVQTDRVSHMFWRQLDPLHPAHDEHGNSDNPIMWIYQQADRILGKTMKQLKVDDRLMVLSDHGFAPYYRHAHLNRWLEQAGYLTLKEGHTDASFSLEHIDWSQTRAYAMGLNGIYLNKQGRETAGIVTADEASALTGELKRGLSEWFDPERDHAVVRNVFDRSDIYQGMNQQLAPDLILGYDRGYRASWQTVLGGAPDELLSDNTDKWSGDHCIDPALVPGILLTNFPVTDVQSIEQMAELASRPHKQTPFRVLDYPGGWLDVPRDFSHAVFKQLAGLGYANVSWLLAGVLVYGLFVLTSRMAGTMHHKKKAVAVTIWVVWVLLITAHVHGVWMASSEISRESSTELNLAVVPKNTVSTPTVQWQNTRQNIIGYKPKLTQPNQWQIDVDDRSLQLVETDGYVLWHANLEHPLLGLVAHQWWHRWLSHPGGYVDPAGQIRAIKLFHPIPNRWWMWLLLGLLVSIILNRFVLRKS
ncbi:alkaline phosphatase family protein [Marinicella sediminis]|uniref:Alkaline phosphatase family protein n=1 Tax=Marinicella sediminis TaxID=1792834 RepID=A0ABV7JFM1_9GAMM|nr:alkaline phosphatase family protein [Marinicella sediminis]